MNTPKADQDLNTLFETLTKGRESCPRCGGYIARAREHGERYRCLICGHRIYIQRGIQLVLDLPPERAPLKDLILS